MKPLLALSLLAAAAAVPTMNILRLASAVQAGETITIGTTVFEIQTLGHTVTTGRTAINLTASPTAAKAALVLTFAANVANNDTVTIGGQVYTFKTTLTASTTANEVLIGADLTASRNNLVAAITKATGGGTTYGSATVANASVTATPSSTDALTATALVAGTAGNSIAVSEAGSQTSWAGGAVALAGGVDATAVEAAAAIITAINSVSTCGVRAQAGTTGEVILVGTRKNAAAIATTETLAGTNNAFAAATTYGGKTETESLPVTVLAKRAALAVEVALGFIRFPLAFTPTAATASIVTSAGVPKAFDGVVTLGTNLVSVDNTGSSDFAAGDIVTIIASK